MDLVRQSKFGVFAYVSVCINSVTWCVHLPCLFNMSLTELILAHNSRNFQGPQIIFEGFQGLITFLNFMDFPGF